MTQHVKIRLPHDVYDGGAVLEVDGTDIAGQVRSVTVTGGVGQTTEVALELPLIEIDGMATITMTAKTRQLLQSYGWVAPEDVAPVAGSQETTGVHWPEVGDTLPDGRVVVEADDDRFDDEAADEPVSGIQESETAR